MSNTYNLDRFIMACESNIITTSAIEGERFDSVILSIKAFIDRITMVIKEIQIKLTEKYGKTADIILDSDSHRINTLQRCHHKVDAILNTLMNPRNIKNTEELDEQIKDIAAELYDIKNSIQKPKKENGSRIVTIKARDITAMIKDTDSSIKTLKGKIRSFEKANVGYIENHGDEEIIRSTISNCNLALKLCMDELQVLMKVITTGTVAHNRAANNDEYFTED